MTMSCATAQERAPELALGILHGAEREEMLFHLAGCTRCQAVVDEHTELADLFPHLAPEVEPPLGFERRVLGVMHGRRRTARRFVAALAATAAAAAITSVALVRVIDANHTTKSAASAPNLRTVTMAGANGQPVGRVTISKGEPAALAVTVDYAVPDGTYSLQLHQGSSAGNELGSITIAGGRGEWSGRAEIPADGRSTIALVDSAGTTVCHAELPASVIPV
jgi:hypothetical protein